MYTNDSQLSPRGHRELNILLLDMIYVIKKENVSVRGIFILHYFQSLKKCHYHYQKK